MAKKQVPAERNRNHKSPQTPKTTTNKSRNPTTIAGDTSSEENAAPSSSSESQNDGEENRVVDKEEINKPKGTEEEEEKPNSIEGQSEEDDAKTKRRKKGDDDVESEKIEHALYTFPMNRVSRIIRSDNPDIRISQEAVFLINRASEKFLQVFCREAYACLYLEGKSCTAYNHLSSVVAKRKRFEFLSDFVPEKVKSEDALAQIPEAEK